MAKRSPMKIGQTRKYGRMTCTKLSKTRKRCSIGKSTFVLDANKRRRKSQPQLKPYQFTKADARGCPKKPSARGRCMAKNVATRLS